MIVRRGLAIVLSLVLSAAALALAPSAMAGDGEPAKDKEPCEKSSTVKLRVTPQDDGRFEVVGIVWTDDDDTWDWKMKHDGEVSADGSVKADPGADKSFKITRMMINWPNETDSFTFRAQNRRTDEVCRASLVY